MRCHVGYFLNNLLLLLKKSVFGIHHSHSGPSICMHTYRQCLFRYAHHHYHMFEQQVPYVLSPWHCESPKITYCSLTHIITQGSQITARQMDPDSCLDCVWDDLLKLNKRSTVIEFDHVAAAVFFLAYR